MESPELRGGGGEERARRMRLRRGVVAFLSRDAAPGSGTEDRSGTHVSECGRHAPSLGRFLEEGHEKLHGLEHAEGLARGAQRFRTDSATPGWPADVNIATYCTSAMNLSLPSALARRPFNWLAYASVASTEAMTIGRGGASAEASKRRRAIVTLTRNQGG